MEVLPKLYKLSTKGKVNEWEISVITSDTGKVYLVTKHGQKDGKIQTERREVKGKNIGRANETSPFQQAKNEAQKKWSDKKKAGYVPNTEQVSQMHVLPMLAKQYSDYSKYLKVPFAAQPKLDGMRALITNHAGEIVITSRAGNLVKTVPHINAEVKKLGFVKPGMYLDGELFTTKFPFEELIGLLKSGTITTEKAAKLKQVQFYSFDTFTTKSPNVPFETRYKVLSKLFKTHSPKTLVLVPTKVVKVLSDTVVKKLRDRYIKQGYEGVIFRNLDSGYGINKRSSDLLKFKRVFDSEFVIVDYQEGKGRDKGTPIFWLTTDKGKRFKARPKGTLTERKKMFQEADTLVGKMATVEYQELSKSGTPRFPVLIRIRETIE